MSGDVEQAWLIISKYDVIDETGSTYRIIILRSTVGGGVIMHT